MRSWQKDALSVIYEARAHATRTSNSQLHQACSRTIEAMTMEGGQVPSELRTYACKILELDKLTIFHQNAVAATPLME